MNRLKKLIGELTKLERDLTVAYDKRSRIKVELVLEKWLEERRTNDL